MNKKDLLLKKKKLLAMLSLSVSMAMTGCEDMRLVQEVPEEIDINKLYDFVVVTGNGNAVIYKHEKNTDNSFGFGDFSGEDGVSIEYDEDLYFRVFDNCVEFNTLQDAKDFANAIIAPEGKVMCMFDEEELNNQQKQNKR